MVANRTLSWVAIVILLFPTHCNQTEAGRNNSLVPCLRNEYKSFHYCYGNGERDQDGDSMMKVYT